jgi:hypothetical protein
MDGSVGSKPAGRILFSTNDVFALALLRDLARFGVPVRDAIRYATWAAGKFDPAIDYKLLAQHEDGSFCVSLDYASEPKISTKSALVVPLSAIHAEVVAAVEALQGESL